MNTFIDLSHQSYTSTTWYVRLEHGKKSIKLLNKVWLQIVSIKVWKKKNWLKNENTKISNKNEDSVVRRRNEPRK